MASREVYGQLAVPRTDLDTSECDLEAMPDSGVVRLIVGEGRLGLEWLKSIELPELAFKSRKQMGGTLSRALPLLSD
jgi:hypothetical protein